MASGKKKQVKRQNERNRICHSREGGNPIFLYSHGGGGIKLSLSITITIPDRLERLFIALTLYYRRGRYGYPFRRIPLTQGKYAIVDPEDFERLNKHKWQAIKSANSFYVSRCYSFRNKRSYIQMHREVIHPPDHLVVDHINHNGLDNRKANLRPATRAQNNFNKVIIIRKNSTSKYKGVSRHKYKKEWRARICVNGEHKLIGHFKDEIHAAKAYDKAAKKYHGEFASLNFPD